MVTIYREVFFKVNCTDNFWGTLATGLTVDIELKTIRSNLSGPHDGGCGRAYVVEVVVNRAFIYSKLSRVPNEKFYFSCRNAVFTI